MKVLSALRWFASVGFKVFRVVPWATCLGVVCTLVSQIASLLAALLPLKVIILLGTERIPSYFPELLQVYGKTVLIVGLGGATLVFFAIHLVAEWSIARLAAFGARKLITNSRKLALFENQELLLTRAYQRFAEALAGWVFLGLAGLALAWVYPLQAIVISSYIIVVWLVLVIIQRLGHVWREQQVGEFIRLVGVLANIGFFCDLFCHRSRCAHGHQSLSFLGHCRSIVSKAIVPPPDFARRRHRESVFATTAIECAVISWASICGPGRIGRCERTLGSRGSRNLYRLVSAAG